MSHFPPGAHIAHGWEGEIPGGGGGKKQQLAAQGAQCENVQDNEALVHRGLSNIPAG